MPKIFVSHAVKDKKIVDTFVDLLHSGMNIDFNEIYCTSQGKLKNGEHFINEIRQNLINSEVVILLLSNNFFDSNFCLNEMGATWALDKPVVPILIPPCGFEVLDNTAFKGVQACRIHIKNDLILIFEHLINGGYIKNATYSRFDTKVDEFLRKRTWDLQGTDTELQSPSSEHIADILESADTNLKQPKLNLAESSNVATLDNINLLRQFLKQASTNQIKVLKWMKSKPGNVSAHILKKDLVFLAPQGALPGVFQSGRWKKISGGTKEGFPFFQIKWNSEVGCGIYRGLTQAEADVLEI